MFDPNKPVRTRDGRAARIICTDVRNDVYPIVALISEEEEEEEVVHTYTSTGAYRRDPNKSSAFDLVNCPTMVTKYINVYLSTNPNDAADVVGFISDTADASLRNSMNALGESDPGALLIAHPVKVPAE